MAARTAPAVARNREPILAVLRDWLPASGLVLEIAAGSGEHALYFAEAFPDLTWQPTDPDEAALDSIEAWRATGALPNLRPALQLDAADPESWPVERAEAVVCINMIHIAPWAAAEGLVAGAAKVLPVGGPLIVYGPFIEAGVETAPSNLAFDADLRARNRAWGLRRLDDIAAMTTAFELAEVRRMPANNLTVLFRRRAAA